MSDVSLSDEDVGKLALAISSALATVLVDQKEGADHQEEKPEVGRRDQRRRGRKKSPYNGQLHLKVRLEEQLWFRELADDLGVLNGRMFEILRYEIDEEKIRRMHQRSTS